MAVVKRLILKSASCFRCFQHLSLTLVATLHANEITTGSLEESSPWSSRTEGKSLQSLKRSNEKETELTHVALNPATCHFMRRTTAPFRAAAPGGDDEPTSRSRTRPSIGTLKPDHAVIPRVAFIS